MTEDALSWTSRSPSLVRVSFGRPGGGSAAGARPRGEGAHKDRMRDNAIRDHLVRLLDWEDAHVGFDAAVAGIPSKARGALAPGFQHSPWQLVEHIRLAQDDILDFCLNASYTHTMKWPDDYWPAASPADAGAWDASIAAFGEARERMKALAREVEDLTALVPTGKGNQTYLRAILLLADHTAYHVGQLVDVRRALGVWPS